LAEPVTGTLVLQSHPLDDSYNMALLDAVVRALDRRAVEHTVHRFQPDGPPADSAIEGCRHLIVVAPTWWGAMPAVVLDWLQRRLEPWIDGGRPADQCPLRSVRRLSVVTSHGSSRWTNLLQGEPGLQLWKRTVLPLCSPDARFDWIALYKIDRLDLDARRAFIASVERRIGEVAAAV
jgi:putative NADPH-quinone reductase